MGRCLLMSCRRFLHAPALRDGSVLLAPVFPDQLTLSKSRSSCSVQYRDGSDGCGWPAEARRSWLALSAVAIWPTWGTALISWLRHNGHAGIISTPTHQARDEDGVLGDGVVRVVLDRLRHRLVVLLRAAFVADLHGSREARGRCRRCGRDVGSVAHSTPRLFTKHALPSQAF